jgi:hypothetical protein
VTNELLPSTAQVLPANQRGLRAPRRTAAVLVASAVVVGVVAVAAWVAARGDSVSGEAQFVLPVQVGDWRLSDGAVTEPLPDADVVATDERFIDSGILYGVADGDGYAGLRSMVVYPESPLPGAEWELVDTPWGDAYRRIDDSVTLARAEERYQGAWEGYGGRWFVASSPSDRIHTYRVIGGDTSDLARVAYFAGLETAEVPTISFMMTAPDGATFTVTTAGGSPLFDAATFAERVEPVDINGSSGWVVTDEADGATHTIVTWSTEPGRRISVRSSAPPDAIVGAARRLQPVTEEEWTSLLR